MKKIFVILAAIAILGMKADGQELGNSWPKVGMPMPPLQFKDIQYYPAKQLNLSDLKGKWIILDFWTEHCMACLDEMPRLDSLQKQFKNTVKVILVGDNSSRYRYIRERYEKVREKNQLSLSIAYDSLAFRQLNVWNPLKLIIDPKGILRGVTERITMSDMQVFLAGKEPKLIKAWFKNENKIIYDPNLPFLSKNNGGEDSDFLYRSILSEFKDYMQGDNQYKFAIKGNKLQVIGTDLTSMYRFAYTGAGRFDYQDSLHGKYAQNPLLEMKDKSAFEVDRDFRTGMYAYSISFPAFRANKASIMKMVQNDLHNYFGYEVKTETRKMPVWKLVLTKKTTSNLHPSQEKAAATYPFDSLKTMLTYIGSWYPKDTFIDFTGINGKMNISLTFNPMNFEDVKRALRENGFDLVKGEKEMQVLVIKDNPDENN